MSLEKIRIAIKRIIAIPQFQFWALILLPFGIGALLAFSALREIANPTKEQIAAIIILSLAVGMAVLLSILNFLQLKEAARFCRNIAADMRRS